MPVTETSKVINLSLSAASLLLALDPEAALKPSTVAPLPREKSEKSTDASSIASFISTTISSILPSPSVSYCHALKKVGTSVSTMRFLLPSSELGSRRGASASVASFPAASLMVPPFNPSAEVFL